MPRSPILARPTARRAALAVALLAAVAVAAPRALGQTAPGEEEAARHELAREQRMLGEDLAAHERARQEEQTAQAALDEVLAAIRSRAAAGNHSGAAELRQAVEDAEAALAAARSRSAAALASIRDRVRRLGLLAGDLAATPAPAVPDVLSGRWRVLIGPVGLAGTFTLRQDGTRVTGTYRLANGRAGSLRGTFVDGRLRLERIDAETGFDSLFEAALDGPQRLAGTWRPMILTSGGPGGGEWAADRVVPAAPEEEVAVDEEEVP